MSRKSLLMLVFAVDIWAAMFIVQRPRKNLPWEVRVAVSDPNQQPKIVTAQPVQVWVTADAIGLWPDLDRPLSVDAVCQELKKAGRDGPDRVELRLLCARELRIEQWGPLATRLAEYAEEIKIAPLPAGR